jgi:hypothetical protein
MFDKFGGWLNQGQNRDLFSVLAGGAGAAIAGPDTWQGRLGNFAGSMGQSGIADAAQQDQRAKLMELLMGALGGRPGEGMPVTNLEQSLRPAAALEGRSKLDELFPALAMAGVQTPANQLGPVAAPAAQAPAAPAAPAAPGGGQASDPFWKRFF